MVKDEGAELLRKHIERLETSIQPQGRTKRERWVARAFLENLGVHFQPSEIAASPNDPPDITFRNANFEIKEVMDPGRLRHAEKKAELAHAKTVTSIFELIKPWPFKGITMKKLHNLCVSHSHVHAAKYPPAVKRELDLLLYVNLKNVTRLRGRTVPNGDVLLAHGWRSVSFLQGDRCCVLAVHPHAPTFLRGLEGQVKYRKYGP